MIWQHLTLNPLAATAMEWRVGCSIALESVLYGLPLTLLFPLAEHWGLIPEATEEKVQTWRWTFGQALAGAVIMIGILALRSPEAADFVYFQF